MDQAFKVDPVTGIRRLLYVVSPNETSFETLEEVPQYINETGSYFMLFVLIEEFILRFYDKGHQERFADGITSIIAGQFFTLINVFTKVLQTAAYCFIYNNLRLADMAWDSPWTWLLAFLGVDLCYYWHHRMSHEMNIMWATHQAHHSSEEFTLSTALRQPILQSSFNWIFNLPLAFFVPPPHMIVHVQFNLIYQFWIHTELISNLGPLEYVLNTPSHHRVHHGRNRYCIDKNYAAVFIIWDRIFGTFAKEDEKIAYGLVHPPKTFNPISVQFFTYTDMWNRVLSTSGIMNKFYVIFYGPGWEPGKPRTGLLEDIPDVKGPVQNKYKTPLPGWLKTYLKIHFALNLVLLNTFLEEYRKGIPRQYFLLGVIFHIYTFTCFGMLCDLRPWWNFLAEMARCAIVLALSSLAIHNGVGPGNALIFLQVTFGLSFLFWFLRLGAQKDDVSKKDDLKQDAMKQHFAKEKAA